jgi:hypothetical protein
LIGAIIQAARPTTNRIASDTQAAFSELLQVVGRTNVIEVLLSREVRQRALTLLQLSPRPGVREILKTRNLTNFVEFEPATLPAGEPLDATIILAAAYYQGDRLSAQLREELESVAIQANAGETNVPPLETVYLDLMRLGQNLDWLQLGELLHQVDRLSTLHVLSSKLVEGEENLPILYTSAVLSEQPGALSKYLQHFSTSANADIRSALVYGKGALVEMLKRQQRIFAPRWRLKLIGYDPFASVFYAFVPWAVTSPMLTAFFRWWLFLAGAFCLGRAVGTLAFPWQVDHGESVDVSRLAQEFTVVLCFFCVVGISAEPFIVSDVPTTPKSIQKGPALLGKLVPVKTNKPNPPAMSTSTLIPLVVFFVLQALIYVWCLAKLSEIRREDLSPRLKLRLLENEDHLFDAGLYLGFAGTVVSLILVSMGVIHQSIMAAYASTSFGIIFVSILKICHIRPLRRRLIMESAETSESAT